MHGGRIYHNFFTIPQATRGKKRKSSRVRRLFPPFLDRELSWLPVRRRVSRSRCLAVSTEHKNAHTSRLQRMTVDATRFFERLAFYTRTGGQGSSRTASGSRRRTREPLRFYCLPMARVGLQIHQILPGLLTPVQAPSVRVKPLTVCTNTE